MPLAGVFAGAATVCLAAGCSIWVAPGPVVAALVRSDSVVPPTRATRRRRPRRRDRRRARAALEREIPQLLDLLAAGSTAGLSAELALRRASEGLGGPLGDALRRAFDRADVGARWRDELRAFGDAAGSHDLRRTVAVLGRTEALGASLAGATRELAASVRQARRADLLERARTAPVKMLFPLVFLILPAFLLLTVVPVLLTTLRSIG
jgi:tight adherence protein C